MRRPWPPPDITTLNVSVSNGSSLTEILLDQLPYGAVFKICGDPHTFVKVQMRPEQAILAFNVTNGVIQPFQPGVIKAVEIDATLILHRAKEFTVL